MKNYYEILEVNNKASLDIIKKVFKLQIKKYHPDVVKEEEKEMAENKVKELNEAYDVLSDEAKRAEYDKALNNELENSIYNNELMHEIENLKQKLQIKEQIIEHFLGNLDLSEYENIQTLYNNGMSSYRDIENRDYKNDYKNDNLEENNSIKEDKKFNFFKWIMKENTTDESISSYYLRILVTFLFRIMLLTIFLILVFAIISFYTKTNLFEVFFSVMSN